MHLLACQFLIYIYTRPLGALLGPAAEGAGLRLSGVGRVSGGLPEGDRIKSFFKTKMATERDAWVKLQTKRWRW